MTAQPRITQLARRAGPAPPTVAPVPAYHEPEPEPVGEWTQGVGKVLFDGG